MAEQSPAGPSAPPHAQAGDARDLLERVAAATEALDRARRAGDPRSAPDFSLFALTGLDELVISRLLAFLLDPGAAHCQGGRFLEAFCTHFGVPQPPPLPLRARCEVSTDLMEERHRRIDIQITCRGWALGIENKPRAGFQDYQIEHYFRQLDRRAPGAAYLVVLKGWEGALPDNQLGDVGRKALADGRIVNSDYVLVQGWLDQCIALSKADYLTAMLKDFRPAVERWLSGGSDMTRQEAIAAELFRSETSLLAGLELVAATDRILEELSVRAVAAIAGALGETPYRLVPPSDGVTRLDKKDAIDIEIAPDLPFVFAISVDRSDLRLVHYGLRPREGRANTVVFGKLRKALRDEGLVSESYALERWFWWRYCESRFDFDRSDKLSVWTAIVKGQFAEGFTDRIAEFDVALRRILPKGWQHFARRARR